MWIFSKLIIYKILYSTVSFKQKNLLSSPNNNMKRRNSKGYGKKSHGEGATARMRENIENQLKRILNELQDLEEMREELDDDEYEESKAESMQELKEFEASLKEMTEGNMDLVSDLSRIQLAIRATVKSAFKTPEVIRLFAQKHPEKLRGRLNTLKRDLKLKKISQDVFNEKASEILVALRKLGEKLDDEESDLIDRNKGLKKLFQAASTTIGGDIEKDVISVAKSSIKNSSSS